MMLAVVDGVEQSTPLSQRLRWFLVGWITVSTILNYMDRQTLSIVAPFLRDEFNLSNQQYSNIVTAFLISYTVIHPTRNHRRRWLNGVLCSTPSTTASIIDPTAAAAS